MRFLRPCVPRFTASYAPAGLASVRVGSSRVRTGGSMVQAAAAVAVPVAAATAAAAANSLRSPPHVGAAGQRAAFEPIEVEKPLTDYRQYRFARLPNNLQVLLVSDAKCDRAGVAMSVQVGSIFDPKEIPGLAHFIEHMLFLGTDKYPKESEYNDYLSKNGGFSNAYTAETVTNYFFSVKPDALDGALDRFAQFFISPCFSESATERELQAVDSEHSKNLQNDGWRGSQLLRNAVNPAHPLNHFMTGNGQTLRDIPAQKGIDVRAALLDFHAKYYSANLMRLVIVGREEPQDLLAMAQAHFSPVVDRGASVARDKEIANGIDAFPPEHLARIVHVVPVNEVRSATFQFVLPSQKALWRSKPTHYISHLIGHEGKGSLLTALKQRGLATELSAGAILEEAGVHVLAVTVMLTEAGEADIGAVGDLVFAYIRLLRVAKPNERVWRELQRLSDIGFRFRSLSDSVSTASGLSHSLQEFPPEVALSADACLWEYDPEHITELLELLRCNRLRLVLASKSYAGRCDREEQWYGTRYSDEPLSADLHTRWEGAGGFDDLFLPTLNPFVPEDLEVREAEGVENSVVPVPLTFNTADDTAYPLPQIVNAYFRKDEEFRLPKAVCAFVLYCPYTAESLENRCCADLWTLAVQEELNEFAYEARVAGLSYSLQGTATGMVLTVAGYNDKLPTLLTAVAQKMASLSDVPEQTYGIVRSILERRLKNAAARSQPYQQGLQFEHCLLHQPAHSYGQRLAALVSTRSSEALSGVNRRLLDHCHVECLLQGNLLAAEARELVRSFVEPLGVSLPLNKLPCVGTAQLPPGWTLLERDGTNSDEKNGAVIVTFQVAEYSLEGHCLTALTAQILSQRFFDELRTKQQLGYIVSASAYIERSGFIGLRLVVQSERPAIEVAARVCSWAEDAWHFLECKIEDAEFEEYRAALLSQLCERPKSLGEEFGLNWAQVTSRTFDFLHREVEAAHVKTLKSEDLRRFASEQISKAPACCILVHAVNAESATVAPEVRDGTSFDRSWTPEDVASFRLSAKWCLRDSEVRTMRTHGLIAGRL